MEQSATDREYQRGYKEGWTRGQDELAQCCLGIIDELRSCAASLRSLADGLMGATINCWTDESLDKCANGARKAIEKAKQAEAIANEWEAKGVPAGYRAVVSQFN